ncbi:MAG TPA: MATE family efflux transporter [Syntrophomonas sp.]|nr:MATE family efflux transporter [Syntrophomonas sp.]
MTNDYLIKTKFRTQAIIVTVSVLTVTIGAFIDGCFIGNYMGADSMAAFGYALPVVVMLVSALGGTFNSGCTACCSVHLGVGDTKKINANFTAGCLLSAVFGLAFMLLFVLYSEQLAAIVGAKDHILPQTADYIRGIGLGAFPMIFAQVLMTYTRLDDDAGLNIVSVLVLAVLNIILDFIFIAQLHMGLFGVGLATSISYAAATAVGLSHFLKKRNTLHLSQNKAILPEIKNILFVGFPTLLNGVCLAVKWLILNNLLFVVGGVIAVSALSVQNNVNQFLQPVILGIGTTLSVMSGIFFGEGDVGAIQRVFKISMKSGVIICSFIGAALFMLAPVIVGFMLNDGGAAQREAIRSLQLFAFSLPISIVVINLLFYYQTIKNFSMANTVSITHALAGPVVTALILAHILGTDGIWIAFTAGEAVALLCVMIQIKVKNKECPLSLNRFLLLPVDYVTKNRHVLDISIKNNITEVMDLSTRIAEFCGQYSKDSKKIDRLSLAIEEIAGNIVTHGFKHPGDRFIDIRIVMEGEDFIFRVRDNGVRFNPLQYEDSENALGIQIIKGIAKSVDYRNTLGFNNLTVIL